MEHGKTILDKARQRVLSLLTLIALNKIKLLTDKLLGECSLN